MEESTNQIVDLDALVPDHRLVVIKYAGKEHELKQPTTADILRLGYYSQKLGNMDSMDPEHVEDTLKHIEEIVKRCVPGLEGDINMTQLLKLVELISEMSVPTDSKILEERGITPSDPKVQ